MFSTLPAADHQFALSTFTLEHYWRSGPPSDCNCSRQSADRTSHFKPLCISTKLCYPIFRHADDAFWIFALPVNGYPYLAKVPLNSYSLTRFFLGSRSLAQREVLSFRPVTVGPNPKPHFSPLGPHLQSRYPIFLLGSISSP
jgi:hypothetical protein